jgi:6-phosphogluconolactonase (cycloisomerase 2 family)
MISAADHSLSVVNGSPFATGKGPVSIGFDSTGSYVYIANYTDGTLSGFTLAAGGVLQALPNSPFAITGIKPNPRQLVTAGNFLYVADHGLNSIDVFSITAGTGQIVEGAMNSPYGTDTGPYALVVDPTGAVLYCANAGTNEAGSVSGYTVNASTGVLTPLATNPLAVPVQGFMTIDPQGKYLLVTETSGVAVYPFNLTTAVLGTVVSGSPFTSGGSNPFAVSVAPSDQFVYVSNNGSTDVAEYRFDSNTGVLTTVTGSPIAAGSDPGSLVAD